MASKLRVTFVEAVIGAIAAVGAAAITDAIVTPKTPDATYMLSEGSRADLAKDSAIGFAAFFIAAGGLAMLRSKKEQNAQAGQSLNIG